MEQVEKDQHTSKWVSEIEDREMGEQSKTKNIMAKYPKSKKKKTKPSSQDSGSSEIQQVNTEKTAAGPNPSETEDKSDTVTCRQ